LREHEHVYAAFVGEEFFSQAFRTKTGSPSRFGGGFVAHFAARFNPMEIDGTKSQPEHETRAFGAVPLSPELVMNPVAQIRPAQSVED
jgi:hypothetical protein